MEGMKGEAPTAEDAEVDWQSLRMEGKGKVRGSSVDASKRFATRKHGESLPAVRGDEGASETLTSGRGSEFVSVDAGLSSSSSSSCFCPLSTDSSGVCIRRPLSPSIGSDDCEADGRRERVLRRTQGGSANGAREVPSSASSSPLKRLRSRSPWILCCARCFRRKAACSFTSTSSSSSASSSKGERGEEGERRKAGWRGELMDG